MSLSIIISTPPSRLLAILLLLATMYATETYRAPPEQGKNCVRSTPAF